MKPFIFLFVVYCKNLESVLGKLLADLVNFLLRHHCVVLFVLYIYFSVYDVVCKDKVLLTLCKAVELIFKKLSCLVNIKAERDCDI